MNKESFKKGGMKWATGFFIFLAILGLCTQVIPHPKLVTDEDTGYSYITWDNSNILVSANETTYLGTASGFLEIYIVNHSTTPTTTYSITGGNPTADNVHNQTATFEGWAQTNMDADAAGGTYFAWSYLTGNTSLARTLTVKALTSFDIVIRYRGSKAHAWDGVKFKNSSCRVKLNVTITSGAGGTGFPISALELTNEQSCNATDHTFIWINAVANNAGAGYQLGKGEVLNIVNIKVEFNY